MDKYNYRVYEQVYKKYKFNGEYVTGNVWVEILGYYRTVKQALSALKEEILGRMINDSSYDEIIAKIDNLKTKIKELEIEE